MAMAEFVLSGQELFGRYARIAYGHALDGKQDYHIYKCIRSFMSNCYCDVPLTYQTENNCHTHDNIVEVVNVIHCGIDENRVIRVARNDIELLPAPDVEPVQEWISVKDRLPEEKVDCIVHYQHAYCDNDGYWAIGICFYDGEKFQLNSAYKVTHWMPLPPEPPEGE